LLLLTVLAVLPPASAETLWTNALPTNGNTGFDAAPVYGSECDTNISTCPGGTTEPYILGDQFTLSDSDTVTSVTIYEVGNQVTTATGIPGDTPNTEFSSLSLYIGPDGSSLGSAVGALSGSALGAASSQVCYSGTCGSGGVNFQSINAGESSDYFAIYAVTFSGLNVSLGPGEYDFAIGATPIGGNTLALLTSDPANSGTSEEDSASLIPNNGFLFFFYDGTGGSPLATYQYAPGSITSYTNGADVNVIIEGSPSVPEPSTFGPIGIGLAGVWAGLRRRARRRRV
jgi:hypothetical protein